MDVMCGPMKKDQGVGTVVNNILYLSLGYHMVFKVLRLKLLSRSQPFLSLALRDETKGRQLCIK